MNELFTYGFDTIEKETKLYGITNLIKLFATKLQLDFLFRIVWLPFQVCQSYK